MRDFLSVRRLPCLTMMRYLRVFVAVTTPPSMIVYLKGDETNKYKIDKAEIEISPPTKGRRGVQGRESGAQRGSQFVRGL